MIVKNINEAELVKNKKINSKFISIYNNALQTDCKILNTDFFLDSFNYFPITREKHSFKNLYSWGDSTKYKNFYTKKQ